MFADGENLARLIVNSFPESRSENVSKPGRPFSVTPPRGICHPNHSTKPPPSVEADRDSNEFIEM